MKWKKGVGLFVIVTIIAVVNCFGVWAMPGNQNWHRIFAVEKTQVVDFAGFQNETYGISLGSEGEVCYTNDGGGSWFRGNNTSMDLYGLDIVSEKAIWSCGVFGHVRISKDKGKNWQAVKNFGDNFYTPFHPMYLSFLDEKTGWIGGLFFLGKTSDGGNSWTEIKRPKDAAEIAAIFLRDANNGYFLDDNNTLYITRDGGETWTEKPVAINEKLTSYGLCLWRNTPAAAIRFISADKGILLIASANGGVWELLTGDGGESWQKEKITDNTGPLYLSHDGKFLTVTGIEEITLLQRQNAW